MLNFLFFLWKMILLKCYMELIVYLHIKNVSNIHFLNCISDLPNKNIKHCLIFILTIIVIHFSLVEMSIYE